MGDAVAVDHTAAQRPARQPSHEPREVGDGVGGDARAGARGAQLAQDPGDRRERGAVERFGAVRRHDRVEHERFDVARIGLRVLLGHLRAVGGAVQHELFVAARDAQRLDVGDGVGRRVEAARRPELRGAFGDRGARGRVGVEFEAVAGERLGEADAALVEHDQIARGRDRAEHLRELFGERQSPPVPGRPRARRSRPSLRRPGRDGGGSRA